MHFSHKYTAHYHIHPLTEHPTACKKGTLAKHTSHFFLPHSDTVVMVVLESKAALKALKPISVNLISPVCGCASNPCEPSRGVPPAQHPRPSNLPVHPLAKHLPHKRTHTHTHTHTPNQTTPHPWQHTTLHTITSTHQQNTPAHTATRTHNEVTSNSDLHPSSQSYQPHAYTITHGPLIRTHQALVPTRITVVMVVLDPKAALESFMPASVTLLSPVRE